MFLAPTWYLGPPFDELRASILSTPSNNAISPSQSSPAIPQQYLADTYLNSGGDIPVLDESNGARDVDIENGAISPHELDTTPRLQQPLSVQSIIDLNSSTVTVTGTRHSAGHSPIDVGAKDNPNHKLDPKAVRKAVMNYYQTFMDESVVLKMFRKKVKDKVASLKNLNASAGKRKHAAKFECPINGCDSLLTRKANLESGLI